MTLRIAMIGACPFPVPQGSQVLLRNAADAMVQLGHEVHLVVYGYGIGQYSGSAIVHRCAHVPFAKKTQAGFSVWKPLLDALMVKTLRHVVREHRIDLVHAHNYEGLLVALASGARPIVYHAHNAMLDELPHFLHPHSFAKRVGVWLDQTFPRRADAVIALHERLADYLVTCGCKPCRTFVIPPSVEVSQKHANSSAHRLPPVVYLGNLDAYQNLKLLHHAADHVRLTRPDARFMVCTHTESFLSWAEIVQMKTWSEAEELLAQDVIVVCPRVSWSGYPIKVLNAMVAGRPIVACESASHGIQHERTGLVVEDNDALGLASAILLLMHDAELRAKLGDEARQWIRDNASFETVGHRIEDVYTTVVNERKPASPQEVREKQNA
jgi:1,2-diacylglycerol 3-alpha-glucosyltransferase